MVFISAGEKHKFVGVSDPEICVLQYTKHPLLLRYRDVETEQTCMY